MRSYLGSNDQSGNPARRAGLFNNEAIASASGVNCLASFFSLRGCRICILVSPSRSLSPYIPNILSINT